MANLDFYHGVEVLDLEGPGPQIRVVRQSVAGFVGSSGKLPVGVPVLVAGSKKLGIQLAGAIKNDGFTLPKCVGGMYNQLAKSSGMAVLINVCDPAVHYTEVTNEVIVLGLDNKVKTAYPYISEVAMNVALSAPIDLRGPVTLPAGVTVTSIKSLDAGTTYVLDTDYEMVGSAVQHVAEGSIPVDGTKVTLNYAIAGGPVLDTDYKVSTDDGEFERIVTGGRILPKSTLKVDYNYVDPTKVEEADILGEITRGGLYKGLDAFRACRSKLGFVPKVLAAPYWTHQKPVVTEANPVALKLAAMAATLRGIAVVDAPNTTQDEVVAYKADFFDKRVYVKDVWHKTTLDDGVTVVVPGSIDTIGRILATDSETGVHESPSNKAFSLVVDVARIVDYEPGNHDDAAQYLNSLWIGCTVRDDGFRLFGNRMSDGTFMTRVRIRDLIDNAVLYSTRFYVDQGLGRVLRDNVVGAVNSFLRDLTKKGVIYGGSCWCDPDDNPEAELNNGHLTVSYDFADVVPTERLTFKSRTNSEYITSIFG